LLDWPTKFELPSDVVALEAGAAFGAGCSGGAVETFTGDIPDGWMGLDIGPDSAARFSELVAKAGTVLWNGPMGAFEDDRFAEGTRAVAMAVANTRAMTVVGGGDSARAVEQFGVALRVDFLSTGGGASLELLEFGDLPALAALRAASNAPRR
jgi:phosphoglycerate kinase